MQRILLISLIFFFMIKLAVSHEYEGTSDNKFQISLKIEKDSSISLIYYQFQKVYAEYSGKITKTNESTLYLSAMRTLGNYFVYIPYKFSPTPPFTVSDTDYLQIDTPFVQPADTVMITYANGTSVNFVPLNKQGKLDTLTLNKKLFNKKKGFDFYTITLKRKNKITNKPLVFRMEPNLVFGAIASEPMRVYLKIKNESIPSLEGFFSEIGDFKLKKKAEAK